uniref:DEP domain-containing protein n=1 Tax=Guillardia theta TaxID=55529 RepID=A0A7S4JD35_GUITH
MLANSREVATLTAFDIYKETIRDLLKPGNQSAGSSSLKLRDSASAVVVDGSVELAVKSIEDLEENLSAFQACRGHCVITVRRPSGCKLFIVKLVDSDAGSTLKQAGAEANETRKWALKSFTALANCLKGAAERSKIIPVRESTLTRMLRECFNSAFITFVGHCRQGESTQDEAMNTLRFAHRIYTARPQGMNGQVVKPAAGKTEKPAKPAAEESEIEPRASLTTVPPPPAPASKEAQVNRELGNDGAEERKTSAEEQEGLKELARAWEYAYQLENLIVWMAEVFQVGAYDPSKLEAMLDSSCKKFNGVGSGENSKDASAMIRDVLASSSEEVLKLPGGRDKMVNFRRNSVSSPWTGELHQILLKHGVVSRLESIEHERMFKSDWRGEGRAEEGREVDTLSLSSKPVRGHEISKLQSYEPPRVVSEDAKFLHLDSRILELEQNVIGGAGNSLDLLDAHIESLRKDVEDSLDHIDDELFANLLSRVSYLKMRREWARENDKGLDLDGSSHMFQPLPKIPEVQKSNGNILQDIQNIRSRVESSAADRSTPLGKAAEHAGESRKRRAENAHVRWSEQNEVMEFQVTTPDKSQDESEEVELPPSWSSASEEELCAEKLLDLLRASLETHERRHQSKVYDKCFSGSQLVDWLVETMDQDNLSYVTKVWSCSIPSLLPNSKISRDQACIIAQGLMNAQVFAHLGSAADFSDDDTLYRFLDGEEQALVLNRQILWAGNARSACSVSQELLRQAILLAHGDGPRDFATVQEFQQRTCELQMVNLIQLPVEELRCFFINIFNVLVLHAKITSKYPSNDSHVVPRCSFFRNTSYQVGKYFYSLDDICRGILRAKKCLFLECDPRVHFALSYGTSATPPARVFTPESLDRQLETATKKFCTERVKVDVSQGEITLPVVFDWYRKDFSNNPSGLLSWVASRLPPSLSHQIAQLAQRKDVKIAFE